MLAWKYLLMKKSGQIRILYFLILIFYNNVIILEVYKIV